MIERLSRPEAYKRGKGSHRAPGPLPESARVFLIMRSLSRNNLQTSQDAEQTREVSNSTPRAQGRTGSIPCQARHCNLHVWKRRLGYLHRFRCVTSETEDALFVSGRQDTALVTKDTSVRFAASSVSLPKSLAYSFNRYLV